MTTIGELQEWCMGAEEELGDASLAICQLFFRWTDSLLEHKGQDLICGMLDREVHLLFADGVPLLFPLITSVTSTVPRAALWRAANLQRRLRGYAVAEPTRHRARIRHRLRRARAAALGEAGDHSMSAPHFLVCLNWDRPKLMAVVARKCGCGQMCMVDVSNVVALDRGKFSVICAKCVIARPDFQAQLADGIAVVHQGRPIELKFHFREDA